MRPLALVTGASKRLGRAIVVDLVERGYDIVLHYNTSRKEAEDLAAHLQRATPGATITPYQADLSKEDACRAFIEQLTRQGQRHPSVCIHNASLFEEDTLATFSPELLQRMMAVHVAGPLLISQALAERAETPDTDHPAPNCHLFILDQQTLDMDAYFLSYTLSRYVAAGLVPLLAKSFAPKVRVNGLALGPVLQAHNQTPEHFAAMRKNSALGYGITVDDVLSSARYLLDTPSLTGETIVLNSGAHLRSPNQDPKLPDPLSGLVRE